MDPFLIVVPLSNSFDDSPSFATIVVSYFHSLLILSLPPSRNSALVYKTLIVLNAIERFLCLEQFNILRVRDTVTEIISWTSVVGRSRLELREKSLKSLVYCL
ncbi:hypothetical protein GEMRC1_002896 [Eukaryota sp. GEM-RC1]